MPRESSSQNLLNFQLECNRIFKETAQGQPKLESHQFSIRNVIGILRKLLRASPSQNLINFQMERKRNVKETAQGQPKLESHQFSIRM